MGEAAGSRVPTPPARRRNWKHDCHALAQDGRTLCGWDDWSHAAAGGYEDRNTSCPECRVKLEASRG